MINPAKGICFSTTASAMDRILRLVQGYKELGEPEQACSRRSGTRSELVKVLWGITSRSPSSALLPCFG